MATSVPNINKVNTGLCPHGLPPGACPICSNAAGSMRQSDRNRNVGEMTYHECAMIGNMLKARALAQKNHKKNLELRLQNLQRFESLLEKLSSKIQEFLNQNNSTGVLKPIVIITSFIAIPILNFIHNLPKVIQNLNSIKFEIQDKLNAIYGEIKNFINKKISELIQTVKNKLDSLFKIFKKNDTKDDDTKIDDDKKIFNLKTIIKKILRKKEEKDECSSKA